MRWTNGCLLLFSALIALSACSTRGSGVPVDTGSGFDTGPDTAADAAVDTFMRPDTMLPDTGPDISNVLVYAHSRDTLYTFSPMTMTVATIGTFANVAGGETPNMLDLAVDSEGNVFTSSSDELWTVDPLTAEVTLVGSFGLGDQLFALSFLAPGEIGDTEVLIGAANSGDYYRIDRGTARATLLGSYPDGWRSSGDIVSVEGLGTFATVARDEFESDVLVRILFSASGTSSTVEILGPITGGGRDFTQVFGIAYWGRSLYGFSNSGELIEINRMTGAGSLVSTETGADSYWGAGVTTVAPVLI